MTDNPRVQLMMLDTAEHSLWRGFEQLEKGIRQDDQLVVKEAVIWVHHGIELVLKQLLVQVNEYLILDDVDKGVSQMRRLRARSEMADATVLDLLMGDQSARTAGYAKLVDRAATILKISPLLAGSDLRNGLDRLTSLRNGLVHSAARFDMCETGQLLVSIINLFLEAVSGDNDGIAFTYNFRMMMPPQIRKASEAVQEYQPRQSKIEERMLAVVRRFRGQEIPGDLFGREGLLTLPDFSNAVVTRELGFRVYLVRGERECWLVAAAGGYANKEQMVVLQQRVERYEGARLCVVGSTHPYRYPDALVIEPADLARLEEILDAQDGGAAELTRLPDENDAGLV